MITRTAVFFAALSLYSSASVASIQTVEPAFNDLSVRQTPCAVNDICFAIDGSGSIGPRAFEMEKNFVNLIVDQVANTASVGTQYSAVVFSSGTQLVQGATQNITKLSAALKTFRQPKGRTSMGGGLALCNRQLRRTTNRVIVLITDGLDNGSPPAQSVATSLKDDKVVIITVGVDDGVNEAFLENLASIPEYFVSSENFSTLPKRVLDVAIRSCAVNPARPPLKNQCGTECRFRLCPNNGVGLPVAPAGRRILLGAEKTALPPYICCPGEGCPASLGRILSTGEPIVSDGGKAVEMSKYSPPVPNVLKRRYPKSYFGVYPIDFNPTRQGIGRLLSRGNQEDFLNGLCVVLPIAAYQVLQADGQVREVLKGSDEKDCVSFVASTAEFIVELQWDSADDFDLVVQEPSGARLSRMNDRTRGGRLINDLNVASCGVAPSGKEIAVYRGNRVESGTYTVSVQHFVNCGGGVTKWKLRVIRGGVVVETASSVTDEDGGGEVGSIQFKI